MPLRRAEDRSRAALVPVRWLYGLPLMLLLAAQLVLAFYAWGLFKRDMAPEVSSKARVVANTVRDKIQYALDAGVPFGHLVGVRSYFGDIARTNPDIAFLVMTSPDGRSIRMFGRVPQDVRPVLRTGLARLDRSHHIGFATKGGYTIARAAIRVGGRMVGVLHVGISESYLDGKMDEIRVDLATVMLTSLLIAFELLLFVTTLNLVGPIRIVFSLLGDVARGDFRHVVKGGLRDELAVIAAVLNSTVETVNAAYGRLAQTARGLHSGARQLAAARADELLASVRTRYRLPDSGHPISYRRPRLIQVRILTFLFTFAEMLSRPFMPVYVGQVTHPIPGIPEQFLLGLPITVFMLTGAFCMPVASTWIGRLGQRRVYTYGAVLAMAGLAGTGAANSMIVLLAWRVLSAVGYAAMFMACQTYLLENSNGKDRAKNTAVFVGALMVAEICAPGIGGILAERVGFRLVFALGAVVAAVSAFLAWRIIYDDSRSKPITVKAAGQEGKVFRLLLRNVRFVALMVFVGLPAKMLLTGFLYYLVPLFLTHLGSTQSEIGRIAMLWGLASVVLAPITAPLADRYKCHGLMVGAGGIIAGIGLVPAILYPDVLHVTLGVAALGIGQALSISPQLALVVTICHREVQEVGISSVLGRYRLLERIGSAIGPFVASALSVKFGEAGAITALGLYGALSAVAFAVIFLVMGVKSDADNFADLQASGAS